VHVDSLRDEAWFHRTIQRGSNRSLAAETGLILGGMRILRIDHVSLNSGDRPRSIAFYQDVLGLGAGTAGPADQPVFVGPSTSQLGLFGDRDPGLRHIALATDPDGQAEVRARLSHLAIPGEFVRHRDHDSLYFRDPDGHMLEVMVPTA
jgi:catechol 2,3-dioxygenase-like lactoylglutathione lyase family enzyme